MSQANRDRLLHEIVSVDGWHSKFNKVGKAKLHLDVTFRKGVIGKEPEARVQFEVSVTRAEVLFVFAESEGIAVVQSSVDRGAIPKGVNIDETTKTLGVRGNAAASVSPTALNASGGISAEAGIDSQSKMSLTSELRPVMARQFKTQDGFYGWELTSADKNGSLLGKVWDPVQEPRLEFREINPSKIPPVSHAIVRCRRDDLKIDSIELKKRRHLSDSFKNNRLAAAEAAIRALLDERNLSTEELSEKYSVIELADVVIDQEIL